MTLCVVFGSAKDASPAASPKVVTPAVDSGVPQYPPAYNGDPAAHIEETPVLTDSSSPAPYMEPALPARYSESDSSTAKETVSSVFHLLRISN